MYNRPGTAGFNCVACRFPPATPVPAVRGGVILEARRGLREVPPIEGVTLVR
jgi:hypothetical protein